MSLERGHLAFILHVCALVGRTSAAVSHVFQQTSDYTIDHRQLHEQRAAETACVPVLAVVGSEADPLASGAIRHSIELGPPLPLTTAQRRPMVAEAVAEGVAELPPGYVSLPAKIDAPPGYQILGKDPPFY